MKTLVLFYSYSGTVKKLAEETAQKVGADLCEVKDLKRPGKLGTFFKGCPAAISGRPTPIERIAADLAQYDAFIVMAPVWASNPAPAINNVFLALPKKDGLKLTLVSAGGGSAKDKVLARLGAMGYTNVEYTDVKAAK